MAMLVMASDAEPLFVMERYCPLAVVPAAVAAKVNPAVGESVAVGVATGVVETLEELLVPLPQPEGSNTTRRPSTTRNFESIRILRAWGAEVWKRRDTIIGVWHARQAAAVRNEGESVLMQPKVILWSGLRRGAPEVVSDAETRTIC